MKRPLQSKSAPPRDTISVAEEQAAPRPMPDWFTIPEVAARWRISRESVRRDVLSNKIPTLKIRRTYRISREVVERMEAEGKTIEPRTPRARQVKQYRNVGVDYFPHR